MANKSKKKDKKDKWYPCPFCKGSGRIDFKRSDTDILGPNSKKLTCPICHGQGRIRDILRYILRPVRVHFKRQPRMIPSRWPRSGRHGRLSRNPIILPPPGTPLSGWPEDDMVPKSTPESAMVYEDIDHKVEDTEVPCKAYPTVLRLAENITITLGTDFPSGLKLDTEHVQTNFKDGLEVDSRFVSAQIIYDSNSSERLETLLSQIAPYERLDIIQLSDGTYAAAGNKDVLFDIKPYESHLETYIPGGNADLEIEMENGIQDAQPLQPHQLNTPLSADVLGPAASQLSDTLNVIGVEDPIDSDIDTNIAGDIVF